MPTETYFDQIKQQLDILKAKVAAKEEQEEMKAQDENMAAIQAIMVGEDALAHQIKFLVDIPKWQQFKVIGSTENTFEEKIQGLASDIGRADVADNAVKLLNLVDELKKEDEKMKELNEKLVSLTNEVKTNKTTENETKL